MKDLDELVSKLRQHKTKGIIEQESLRSLVILFHAILEKGGELAFVAAKAYILLLQVPGANIRNILHPYVLRLVMNLLKRTKKVQDSADPFNNENKKRKKQKKGSDDEDMGQDEQEDQQEANTDGEESYPFAEYAEELMHDLQSFFSVFSLEPYSQSLLHSIEVLAHVTRTPSHNDTKESSKKRKSKKDSPQLSNLNEIAYKLLALLLLPIHGTPSITFSQILKELLPNMLHHYSGPLRSGPIPKHVLAVCADTVSFVTKVISSSSDKDNLIEPIHVFLQHICTRVADRAEYRAETSFGVCELLKGLPLGETTKFITFLSKLSKTAKSNQRHLAVEVSVKLLLNLHETKEISGQESQFTKPLVEILIRRSSDKIAVIRAKALGYVASTIQHMNANPELPGNDKLVKFITHSFSAAKSCDNTPDKEYIRDDVQQGDDTDRMLEFLKKRAQDEKSGVRRSALLVVEALYSSSVRGVPGCSVLAVFVSCATDPSPLIRKQTISSLTELVDAHSQNQRIFDTWLKVVFPLTGDRESTVQDKALDAVSAVILQRIVHGSSNIWELLQDLDAENCRYLHRVCALLVRKKSLPDGLVKHVMKAIANDERSKRHGAWILLSELAPCCPKQVDHKAVLQEWSFVRENLKTEREEQVTHAIRVLRILESVANILPASAATSVAEDIYRRLSTFSYPHVLVQCFIFVLGPLAANTGSLNNWPSTLVNKCDDALSSFVLPTTNTKDNSPAKAESSAVVSELERYLYALGELVQGYDVTVSSRVVTVVQALLAPDLNSISIPSSVRAHAFVVLGKLCLTSEPLAKRCITVFARELETSKDPVIRNNVMVVMCDLCIRYTAIVDRYIPNIAMCLRDESELVRKQTLMLLTRLLQEDYVKWKGQLFYRFVVSLVDPSAQIREFAQYCLVDCLYTKHTTMFFSHFMETIFVLNDYRSHPVYNQAPQSDKERSLFSLKGEEKRRMALYNIFLSHMTDEQKFQLTAKICQEVIGDLVDGKMALSQSADVLQDSLLILASKEIKLSSSRNASEDAEDEQESALSAAKGKLLSKIVKKNILENIVPILVELKHLLEQHRSPLLKYLMMYLKELLKDFKSELQDIVVGDKQLAKELEYDLRMWEKKASTPTSMLSPTQTLFKARNTPRPDLSKTMFSPKARNTPRPDLAKFSVPKLRPTPSASKTPLKIITSSSKTPMKGDSPASTDSPYKTPHKSNKSASPSNDKKLIAFTPDPSCQRRWSIELVDENDKNAPNKDNVKKEKKEKDSKTKRVTKKREAPAKKKSGKLTYDDEEEESEEADVPVQAAKKSRARV
eukprot:Phypoly_transcript_00677.p1 GENE.Phypoly_transcript_00677~~Phypoly_transcript_00677.p1  ORF type:complete len:1381 (+),score=215.83 Phypoly_transcript_00677:207-4145(+)